ncbi:flavin reductase family protein [Pseudomonas sp.]|uniref:flavin reductase family protein n=1 Tax=Pseudomonas sp. TaxID=306 RepID=UPI002735BE17|nr:iron-sulfur cluster-binding domain-containing protein [Pseudomonas sp.]MDP3814175.1 iron-sulfur cluster-binding domain-containing protein [Pseudomonas sp.]
MALMPFAWMRGLSLWLRPLRGLVARGWLRESDVDTWLALLHPALRLNRVMARVVARQWVADDMLALCLRPNGNWRGAQPGQHLQLYLQRNGVRLSRSYSLTALHADGSLEIAIKRQPGGRVSPYLLEQLAVGELLELGPVHGQLCWPAAAQGVLLLAAGSGITPLLGLLRAALAQGCSAPISLLHYVREQGQRAFVAELQALQGQYSNLQVRWALTGADAVDTELQGRFRAEHLQAVADLSQRAVLSCGPAGFVGQVQQWWQGAGGHGELQVEAFTPPALSADISLRSVRLGFARSRQVAQADNQRSLLEQAEALGLKPAHGCRQGICASCTCTLLSGVVRDLRSGALFSEPGQPIRLCVSAPHGDVEIDL